MTLWDKLAAAEVLWLCFFTSMHLHLYCTCFYLYSTFLLSSFRLSIFFLSLSMILLPKSLFNLRSTFHFFFFWKEIKSFLHQPIQKCHSNQFESISWKVAQKGSNCSEEMSQNMKSNLFHFCLFRAERWRFGFTGLKTDLDLWFAWNRPNSLT